MRKGMEHNNHRIFEAVFDSEHDLMTAARNLRDRGYTLLDAYTPYAVHGLDKLLGLRPSRLPLVCLIMGLTGAAAKLGFQVWTSAGSWPLNVGGKPLASIPAFVPVTFEITVLFAGVGTVAAFLLRSRLWPGKRVSLPHPRSTDDAFVLHVLEDRADFDTRLVGGICRSLHAVEINERALDSGAEGRA